MKQICKKKGALLLAGVMLCGSSFPVCAEEVTPPGYHVYDIQEDEVSDTWYGIARGDYLMSSVVKLTHGDKDGYAACSGTTFAQGKCDRVAVCVYLDWSDTPDGGWATYDTYWTSIENNSLAASASSGQFKVKRKKYHRARGSHSVTEDGNVEMTTTCTDILYFK